MGNCVHRKGISFGLKESVKRAYLDKRRCQPTARHGIALARACRSLPRWRLAAGCIDTALGVPDHSVGSGLGVDSVRHITSFTSD